MERMNAHYEAWEHVQKQLFGDVCEITMTTPWGFKERDPSGITNISVEQFLKNPKRYDTIILHILQGEGLPTDKFDKVKELAEAHCIKIIILEHNPKSKDFFGTEVQHITLSKNPRSYVTTECWGRNQLEAYLTIGNVNIPNFNDDYWQTHKDKRFVVKGDKGIDQDNLIYVRTSEEKFPTKLPDTNRHWVIGGGFAFEYPLSLKDTLFDPILAQCMWAAYQIGDQKDRWKINRLYPWIKPLAKEDTIEAQGENPTHWRRVYVHPKINCNIVHGSLQDLKVKDSMVYVSTVHNDYWAHLVKDNIILDAWSNRDKPRWLNWKP
jgi:hypothetical protein